MTERRDGHSKLVYDKEKRTIVPVDPHPQTAPTAAEFYASATPRQARKRALRDKRVPMSVLQPRPSKAKLCAAAHDMLAVLEAASHTLEVHGHIDSGTGLHEMIRATIARAKA